MVTGDGDKYKVEGTIKSDALAADNRAPAGFERDRQRQRPGQELMTSTAKRSPALLSAGDFQLNNVQLVGGVMGTGSDFRWVGELRAAAEKKLRHNDHRFDSSGCARGDERWRAHCFVAAV